MGSSPPEFDMSHETPAVTERPPTWYRNVKTTAVRTARRARDVFVYSSAYLAVIAAAQVLLATWVLPLRTSLAPAVVGLVTFAVYVTDRVADADTDAASMPDQAAFASEHGDALYVAACFAYGLAVSLSLLGGPMALAITLLPGAFWVVYAADWLPDVGLGIRRLKDVLLLNTGVVALAWAVTLVFLPLAFAARTVTPGVAVVFCYFFLRVFSNTEIPNVRDMDADREIGVRTIPTVVGVRRTRHLLYGLDLLTAALVAGAVAVGYLPAFALAPLLAGVVYSSVVVSRLGRDADVGRLTTAAECEFVVSLLVLLAVV